MSASVICLNLLNRCQRTIAYRAVFRTRLKPI